MTYKNFIWDLGGTLLDNYEASSHAFVAVLYRHGRIALHEEVYADLKVSTAYAVAQLASGIPNFLSEYKRLEAESLEHPILFDGAKALLAQIALSGGKNFLISHRDKQVLSILETSQIAPYFSEIVTSENGFERKPAPDSINYLLNKYQLDKSETLMIGDRPLDIEAGQRSGIDTIFFDPGESAQQATYSFHHLADIAQLL